jgi:hypothetical protein
MKIHALRSAILAGSLLALAAGGLRAQSYPTNSPSYVPQALLPAQTLTATGASTPFLVNGVQTLYIRITGTFSALSATVQGTEALRSGATPAWTNLAVDPVGTGATGGRVAAISAAGLYKINVSGLSEIRLNVATLTGTNVIVSWSGGYGTEFARTLPVIRNSYSAASLIATGATTHFLTIFGSATKTVRVTHAECSGTATAAAEVQITAEVVSAVDSVDAGTAVTGVPHDSADAAASAVVTKHTTSPTSGALVGLVRAASMMLGAVATALPPTILSWDFGTRPGEQEIVLRGVAQGLGFNTSAAFGTGASVGCALGWTEE